LIDFNLNAQYSALPFSHQPLSNFEAGKQSLFIIDYAEVIQSGAVFPSENQNHVQISGRGTSKSCNNES